MPTPFNFPLPSCFCCDLVPSPARRGPFQVAALRCAESPQAFRAPGSTDASKPVGSSCVCRKEGLGLDLLPESRVRLCPVLPPP